MTPISHIQVATDFSDRATFAVERAAELTREHHATLHLLHVQDRSVLQLIANAIDKPPPASVQRLLDSARERLAQLAQEVAARFAIPIKHSVLTGRVHDQMDLYARSQAIDLSVFGAHGANFARDVFVGSKASKFLRKGQQPTLVVRSSARDPYREVLVAVDFSPPSRLAVEWAIRVAPKASIQVLHVSELPLEGKLRYAGVSEDEISSYRHDAAHHARQTLDAFLGDIQGASRLSRLVIAGSPSRTVIAQSHMRAADLVVMGKRGQLEFDELLLGSVTLRVLEEIDRDLLLVAPST